MLSEVVGLCFQIAGKLKVGLSYFFAEASAVLIYSAGHGSHSVLCVHTQCWSAKDIVTIHLRGDTNIPVALS